VSLFQLIGEKFVKLFDKYFKINGSKNAVDTASDENDRRNIIFSGNTGVGKTYLSNCIAKVLLDRYYSVIYCIRAFFVFKMKLEVYNIKYPGDKVT